MTTPVHLHLVVFTLSIPHCSTSKHCSCKSLCQPSHLKEVSGVLSGLQIVALRETSLAPGYVKKTQLPLTNEIAVELFKLSAQSQFCLNLNRCALHTLSNNADLIKQTHRERRLRRRQCCSVALPWPTASLHIILMWRDYCNGNGNGLLFHMTQPISRSTIKAIACSKPTISEH